MSESAPVAQYQCSQCSAKYVRMDHLRRHEAKHEGQRLCVCKFCNSEFHRRDILRRHYKTCKQRGDNPIPEPQKRGRRKQACDRCATFKQACNREQPCLTCVSSGSVCSWDRVQSKDTAGSTVDRVRLSSHAVSVASSPPESSPSEVVARESPLLTMGQTNDFPLGHMSVPFILNFVSPESRTFVDTFGYSSIAPEPVWKASWLVSPSQQSTEIPMQATNFDIGELLPSTSFTGTSTNGMYFDDLSSTELNGLCQNSMVDTTSAHAVFRDFQMGKEPAIHSHSPANSGSRGAESIRHPRMGSESGSTPNPLKRRLSELVMQLTDTYINLPKRHPACASDVRIKEAGTFFTISNLQMFTETYFHHFYPHCPIIHKSSFDMGTVSLPLILVICLAGAVYSSILNRVTVARSLLDLAEEYVFRTMDIELSSRDPVEEGVEDWNVYMQTLQAALTIAFLQNWEGNEMARRRIRRERLARLVSVSLYTLQHLYDALIYAPALTKCTHSLKLTSAKNQVFEEISAESPGTFDWQYFTEMETRLRVLSYVFILDRGLCIFHNYHPKIPLLEMAAELPCKESTFTASSSAECFQRACNEKALRAPKLHVLLNSFLGESFEMEREKLSKKLSTLHLFLIINALHTIIWTARTNFLGSISIDILTRALTRWKALWDEHIHEIATREFRRLGFVRNASEYWWVARLQLFLMSRAVETESVDGTSESLAMSFEDDDMSHIRSLLRKYCYRGSSEFEQQR